MDIYLLRHGEAEGFAKSDELRNLTPSGMEMVSRVASLLPEKIDYVWVSPYLRARQSLEQVMAVRPGFPQAKVADFLTPDSDPDLAINELLKIKHSDSSVLLVFHQPIIGRLAQLLVDNDDSYGLSVPTSGLIKIQAEVPAAGCGDLVWMKDGIKKA